MSILFLVVISVAKAQLKPGEVENAYTNNIFTKEFHGGVMLHSAGLGVNFTYGKFKTAKKVIEYHVDIVNLKHPQEKKIVNPIKVVENAKSYAYGKLNGVLLLRPSYGIKKILSKKSRPNGVQVSYAYGVGGTVGFVKPVYLIVSYDDIQGVYSEEKYDPEKHDIFNIIGRSSGLMGFNEMKFALGGNARFALNFEYAPNSEGYKALEVGAMLDVFPQKIEIMANENNSSVFLNLYVSLLFGKKIPR